MKKKKNAFTLIELLAIIVILAIIAVITVPIILNIIENSRMGAATDSAYGYKDSVNKTYITELQTYNTLKLEGEYTVNSDGQLVPATNNTFKFGVSDYNTLPVSVSGDKPTSGSLTYSNNTLTGGCLVIGDYQVTFGSNGSVTDTKKGDCLTRYTVTFNSNGGSTIAGYPKQVVSGTTIADPTEPTKENVTFGGWYTDSNLTNPFSFSTPITSNITLYAKWEEPQAVRLYDSTGTSAKTKSTIDIGDMAKIGNEEFYVVNPNANGKLLLLPKYNLSSSNIQVDNNDAEYYESTYGNLYWYNIEDEYTSCNEDECEGEYDVNYTCESGNCYYMEPNIVEGYVGNYRTDVSGYKYVYRDVNNEDISSEIIGDYNFTYSGFFIYINVNSYKDYLKNTLNAPILDARLMSYDEANSIISYDWSHNQTYWLGSEYSHPTIEQWNGGFSEGEMWYVCYDEYLEGVHGEYDRLTYTTATTEDGMGVRPIIEILLSDL